MLDSAETRQPPVAQVEVLRGHQPCLPSVPMPIGLVALPAGRPDILWDILFTMTPALPAPGSGAGFAQRASESHSGLRNSHTTTPGHNSWPPPAPTSEFSSFPRVPPAQLRCPQVQRPTLAVKHSYPGSLTRGSFWLSFHEHSELAMHFPKTSSMELPTSLPSRWFGNQGSCSISLELVDLNLEIPASVRT